MHCTIALFRTHAASVFLLAACHTPQMSSVLREVTCIEGTVWLDQPVQEATVQLSDVDTQGNLGPVLARATTNSQGHWRADVRSHEGPIHISASQAHLTAPLQAYVPWVSAGTDVGQVVVTPISHLAAAYARYLMRQPTEPQDAIERAQARINALFGDHPHHVTIPHVWPETPEQANPQPWTHAVASALYLHGFKHLADTRSHDQGVTLNAPLSVMDVLELLAEDVEADGVFDGLGRSGQTLKVGQQNLSSHFLRTDVAQALVAVVQQHPHAYGLDEHAVVPLARGHTEYRGPLFNEAARPFFEGGPTLAGCTATTRHGRQRDLSWPQHGVLEITCTWNDPRGIKHASASCDTLPELAPVPGLYLPAISHFTVDLSASPARTHTVDLRATNMDGVSSHSTLSLKVDQAPLTLTCPQAVAWSDGQSPFEVSFSASKPLRRVVGQVLGLPDTEQQFETHFDAKDPGPLAGGLTFTHSCPSGDYDVQLTAEDWAGHTTQLLVPLLCRDRAPSIFPLDFRHHGDFGNHTVDVAQGQWPSPPPTFNKLVHRFDWLPEVGLSPDAQNLPVVRFRLASPSSRHADIERSMVSLSYRCSLPDASEAESAWRPWSAEADGTFALPLAFQTLLPQRTAEESLAQIRHNNTVARAQPDALHLLEVRARSPLGHEHVVSFPFYLKFKSPAITLTACQGVPWLEAGSYADLKHFDAAAAAVVAPFVRWPVPRPQGSWAPLGALNVQVLPLGPVRFGTSELHHWAGWTQQRPACADASREAVRTCWVQHDGTSGYHVLWEDGGCSRLDTFNLRSSRETLPLETVPLVPMRLTLAANRDTAVALGLAHRPQVAGLTTVATPNGQEEYLWRRARGCSLNVRSTQFIESSESLADVWVTLPGLTVFFEPSADGLPPPLGVERDSSCPFTLGNAHQYVWAGPQ